MRTDFFFQFYKSVVNFLLIKGVNLVSASSHSFGLVLTQSKPTCCILQLWILTEKGPPKQACEQGYTRVNTAQWIQASPGAPCLSLSQPFIPFQDSLSYLITKGSRLLSYNNKLCSESQWFSQVANRVIGLIGISVAKRTRNPLVWIQRHGSKCFRVLIENENDAEFNWQDIDHRPFFITPV